MTGENMWEWEALENECKNCTKCELHKSRQNVVIDRGSRNATLMFVGEAPGANEDRMGKAFVGQAGKLLDLVCKGLGISEEEFYISNILKCRPPGNANPTDEQARLCMPYLKNQIELLKPKVIVLLGGQALKHIIEGSSGITRSRGNWTELNGIPVMPTYHPAALLRDSSKKMDMWKDIKNAWIRLKNI